MKKLKQMACVILSVLIIISILSINASAASKPKLSSTSLIMSVGSSKTLKVTGTSDSVTWSSSDTSVCSVSKYGKIKAKDTGTAKICARVGNKKLYCKVKVVSSYISSISPKVINKGEQATLYLKSYNVKSVNAYSSDIGIVKVVNGSVSDDKVKVVIEAISSGTAYINVTDKNNKAASAKVEITVNAAPDTSSNTNNGTASIRIKIVDNGDGTTSISLIPVNDLSQSDNSGSSADYAKEILDLVNEERAKAGVPAIKLDDDLCKAAQVRAKEIGESFSHTRPDGSDCFTVLKDYSVSCVYAGENIAKGSSTAGGAMKQWMNSTGHRSNILRSGWYKLGVGYDEATNSWVQIFTD